MLTTQTGSGDLGTELLAFIAQVVVALAFAKHQTWKVGVFRAKPMQIRRCVFKRTGLTQDEAKEQVEHLRECVRNGDMSRT